MQPVLMLTEPLVGWRHVVLSDRRTRIDFAHCIKEPVDIHYPEAEAIVVVMDNLKNTHAPASLLYEAFPPPEEKPKGWPSAWRTAIRPNTAVG